MFPLKLRWQGGVTYRQAQEARRAHWQEGEPRSSSSSRDPDQGRTGSRARQRRHPSASCHGTTTCGTAGSCRTHPRWQLAPKRPGPTVTGGARRGTEGYGRRRLSTMQPSRAREMRWGGSEGLGGGRGGGQEARGGPERLGVEDLRRWPRRARKSGGGRGLR